MEITKWSGEQPATEEVVKDLVRHSGLPAYLWQGDPNKCYPPHHHPHTKTLWVARGTITFYVNEQSIPLAAGDRMVLPAGTRHAADAGPEGVACYESPPVHDNPSLHDDK